MLASINFDEADCVDAAINYRKALDLVPTSSSFHYDLALTYFCEKKYTLASSELETAMNLSRKEKRTDEVKNFQDKVNLQLANTLLKVGELQGARKIIGASLNPASANKKEYGLLSAIGFFNQNDVNGFRRAHNQVNTFATAENKSDPKAWPTPPLDRLFTAWFLEMEGKEKEADKILESISTRPNRWEQTGCGDMDHPFSLPNDEGAACHEREEMLRSENPIGLTWFDLIYRCGNQKPISV
jgi:hypothetical protein